MSLAENIIAGIIIFLIFIASGVMYVAKTTEKKVDLEKQHNTFFLDRKLTNSFDTSLSMIEPVTGRQFGDLLGSATYYKTGILNVSGTALNVSYEFEKALDSVLGGKEFYFETFPLLQSITLVFFITSDERMQDVFAVLERDYDNLIIDLNSVYQDIEIRGRVIILEGADLCIGAPLDCEAYTESDMYNNNQSSNIEMMKYRYGLFRPGSGSYSNDWETAVSYYMIKTTNYNLTKMEILFPIVDSLSAASDGDKCPTQYAADILKRDIPIFKEFWFIVNPIVVDNGDSSYCLSDVQSQAESLVAGTKGIIAPYNQNFLTDIHKTVEKNLYSMHVIGGVKSSTEKYVMQRKLQLPDGRLANTRLHVYT